MKTNKFFFASMLVAALAMGLTACNGKDKEPDDPFGNGGNGGNTENPGETEQPSGDADGSRTAPYVVNDNIAQDGNYAYVKGYIVGCYNFDNSSKFVIGTDNAVKTSLLIAATPDHTDTFSGIMSVQLSSGTAVQDALNLVDHPENFQKEVILYGTLEKYCGIVGIKNVSYAILEGNGVGVDPDVKAEEITIAKALEIIAGLAEGASTDVNYVVEGKVSKIITTDENIVTYKNCDFMMSDGTNEIKAFRTKGYDGADFTVGLISVDDVVKVEGPLTRYVKNGAEDPEINKGKLVK